MAIPAQSKYVLLTVLFIMASINFTRTAMEIIENSKRLDNLSQEVSDLEREKEDLKNSVSYKQTDEYIEEKARNDLNMKRPGEKVYVIPKGFTQTNLEEKVLGVKKATINIGYSDNESGSNPQKWLSLFLRR